MATPPLKENQLKRPTLERTLITTISWTKPTAVSPLAQLIMANKLTDVPVPILGASGPKKDFVLADDHSFLPLQ